MVPLLLVYCLLMFPLFVGVQCFWSLLCYTVPSILSSFSIILIGKRELIASINDFLL